MYFFKQVLGKLFQFLLNYIIYLFCQCGSLTGATFGFVDVLRDSKIMMAKKSVATAKILRYTALFGG